MKLDLSKLTDAVTKVAGIAAERDALVADAKASQEAVDTLTASLIAATTSPAGAVGLAAVASALAVPTGALSPDAVQAAIEAAKAQ